MVTRIFLTVAVLAVLLLDSQPAYSQGSCEEGEIRLANSNSPLEGRVEVCMGGVWGTVCDRNGRRWYREARVVCRQVGHQLGVEIFTGIHRGDTFSTYRTNIPIHLSSVTCNGTEESLMDCSSQEVTSRCRHNDDAGVTCIPTNSPLLPTCASELQNFTDSYVPFACPQPVDGRSKCLVDISNRQDRNPFVCNGGNDCGDCSDECHCDLYGGGYGDCRYGGRTVTVCNCTEDEFQCRNGFCVPREGLCNGYNECGDNSDETDQYCIDLSLSKIRFSADRVEAQLRLQLLLIGIGVAVVFGITLISAVVLVLCMLVPRCPLRKVYSAKPGAGVDADGGRGTREGPREGSGERGDNQLERSGAPLITDTQHNTS